MKTEIIKLAKLLKTSEGVISDLEEKMGKISRKKGVIAKIIQGNKAKIQESLEELNLNNPKAEQVYQALINKAKENDQALFNHFNQPDFSTTDGCRVLIDTVKGLVGDLTGFYLKKEKAKELLRLNPPKNILSDLGYGNNVDEMLKQEDVFEIFSALRFAEDSNWLNNVFFRSYLDLKKEDFEKRKIEIIVLSKRWADIGQKFLGKKLHHMSHLKELGVVFAIPIRKASVGETLYMFFMTLHYIYEVDWHSRLFEEYSRSPDFAQKMTKALKVETSSAPLPNGEKMSWRIIPAYLAKKNPDDSRLTKPHINPEAWHYAKTDKAIDKFSQSAPQLGLGFWQGLSAVIDYFSLDDSEKEAPVSFNLFDNGISLLGQVDFKSRYLYHQQEALWNKLFVEYMGEETIDKLMRENLNKGYVEL
jgi:hypothetical protein